MNATATAPAKRKIKNYRDLEVWKLAIELVEDFDSLTGDFPEEDNYRLARQLRRTVLSVSAFIAEGYGRSNRGDFLRGLSAARGSIAKAESLMIVAGRLGYADRDQMVEPWSKLQRTGKMLKRLKHALRNKQALRQ